jgi:GR25 family glycosyltransferase involved in LPS biosynthesis
MHIGKYFDQIICINRVSRTDRRRHAAAQAIRCELFDHDNFQFFTAHDGHMLDGTFNGNFGCTASHRGVLELIAHHGWERTLVLEDDFDVVEPGRYADHAKNRLPFNEQWAKMIGEVPDDWEMLYLGGHYAEAPIARVSEHVIRIGRMLTTSSYGITAKFARKIAPHISGIGPIDVLYGGFHRENRCYCFTPRLMVQYENLSDLQHRKMDNSQCMLDPNHEAMVPFSD